MAQVYLLLGSNLGERENMLEQCLVQLGRKAGKITGRSSVYETEPWGNPLQPWFLNQVIKLETSCEPFRLLELLQGIEAQLGRIRTGTLWMARPVDIDILFYDDLVVQTGHLTIPHPMLHLRSFSLVPLGELAGGLVHPVLNLTISQLISLCEDPLIVKIYHERAPVKDFINNV
jgi:2-amino-4-hydroxy-6-hydroxymethyldihydropteridine diphosphokinase